MITRRMSQAFSRRNGAAGIVTQEPMTLDHIRRIAPSVFAEGRHESRSDRFSYIPTSQIVEHLMGRGYGVFAAMQGGSRVEGKREFTKHLVRLRNLSQTSTAGTQPEIVLCNAHDGTSAYKLMAGVIRFICSNGLIVADSLISDVKIRHTGNILQDVSEGVSTLANQLPALSAHVESFQGIQLSRPEQEAFARAALQAKYGEEAAPIQAEQLLGTRRHEDRGSDMWSTLNVVQENLIRGGNHYRTETKTGRIQHRKTGAVNSIDGQTSLNRAVWTLAEEMRKIKTGVA